MIGSDLRHIFYRSLSGSGGGNSGRAIRAAYIGLGNNQKAKVWGDKYMEQYNAPASTVVSGYQLYTTKSSQVGLTVDDVIPCGRTEITYSNPSFSVLTKNTVMLYEDPRYGVIKEENDVPDNPYRGNAFSSANGKWKFYLDGNTNGIETTVNNNERSITFPAAPSNSPSGIIAHTNIYALPMNMHDIEEFRNLPDKVNVGNGNAVYYQATNPYAIWGSGVGYLAGVTDNSFSKAGDEYTWSTTGYNSTLTIKAIADCAVHLTLEGGVNTKYGLIRLHNLGYSGVEDIFGNMNNVETQVILGSIDTGTYTCWNKFTGGTKIVELYKGDSLVIKQMSGEGSRNIVITLGSYSNGSTEARIINPANGDPMAIGSATTTIAGGMVEANGYTPTGVTIGSSSTNHLGANYILKSTATIPSPAGTYVIKCTTGNTAKPTLTIGTVTKAEAVKKMTVTGSGADGIINAALPATGDTNSIQVTTPVEDISSGAYMYVTFKAKQSTSATLLVQNHSSNTAKCFIVSGSMTSPLYASINATTGGSYTLTANTVYTIGIVFDEDRSPMGTASISISTS